MPTEPKQTETSEDTVIQTIQMGCSKRIARRFTTHSLNMERLLATSFQQQQIHLETAHCRRQSCDFLLVLYKKIQVSLEIRHKQWYKSIKQKNLFKECARSILQNSYLGSGFWKLPAGLFVRRGFFTTPLFHSYIPPLSKTTK